MKRALTLLAVTMLTANSVGCCCCRGLRDWFYQGAMCGPSAPATYAAVPAPQYAAPQQYAVPQQFAVAPPMTPVFNEAACGVPYAAEMGCGVPYMMDPGCAYPGGAGYGASDMPMYMDPGPAPTQ